MPFFLKPCLKLRRKKNKKKSKSEETIKRVSDITVPVTTDEIWQECELDSSASNVSGNTDLSLSSITKSKNLAQPISSENEEISGDEQQNCCIRNQNDAESSQDVSAVLSHEFVRVERDEESGNVFTPDKNREEIDTDIVRKQSIESLQVVNDKQVDDIDESKERNLEENVENTGISFNEEAINEPNLSLLSDLNNIDINTDVMRKIEELRYIGNSFKQGDQNFFENVEEKNDKDIPEEIHNGDDKNAYSPFKYLNSQEKKLIETLTSVKRNDFTCGTFKDKLDYAENETPIHGVNVDILADKYRTQSSRLNSNICVNKSFPKCANYGNNTGTAPFKQNSKIKLDRESCKENTSSNLVNNSAESRKCFAEDQEIDKQKVDNESLNIKENLDFNYSITDGDQHSASSTHRTQYLNSCKKSMDNENTSTRHEMYNFLHTDDFKNEFLSQHSSLNEMETFDSQTNNKVEASTPVLDYEISVGIDDISLPKESQSGNISSNQIKEGDNNDRDCKGDELKSFGSKNCSYNSNNNLEIDGDKEKNNEIPLDESHQYDSDFRSAHTKEFKVRKNDLNASNGKVDLLNNFKDHGERGGERNKKPDICNDKQLILDGNKCSHLTVLENSRSSQINANNFPPNFEQVNSFNGNEDSSGEKYNLSDLEDECSFQMKRNNCETLKNVEYDEEPLHLIKEFDVDQKIDNFHENISGNVGKINPFPNKPEETTHNSCAHNDNYLHISSFCDNGIDHASKNYHTNINKPCEELQEMCTHILSERDDQDPSTPNVGNNDSTEVSKKAEYKKSVEENIAFKLEEASFRNSEINIRSCNEMGSSSNNLKEQEIYEGQRSKTPCKIKDFLYPEDNYNVQKLHEHGTNNHYYESLYPTKTEGEIYDYEKQMLFENKCCESQTDDTFNLENVKYEERNTDKILEEYENRTLNDIYEKYYSSQTTHSPKCLNRFSNISSTSESTISSRLSDKSCSKTTGVMKKESSSFSISACGDSRNNENIDETTDFFKSVHKENDMLQFKETGKAASLDKKHAITREPKLTISITRKKMNDAMKNAENITKNQASDAFRRGFRSMDSNEIDRIRESIEIFNKKKEQALSDMKPNIRVIPVKRAGIFKISTKTEKIDVPQKARSPFTKFPLISTHNELERNIKNLMPEVLLKINENIESNQTLRQNAKVKKLFRRKEAKFSHSSESETESSQSSENISPVRKRILNASREIRSPKYPFRTLQRMSVGKPHFLKRPVIIKSPKVNLVAYLTKDEKNIYQVKRGYRMYNQESGNFQIFTQDYKQSEYKNSTENLANSTTTSPDYLKPKFDDIFRRYAKKGRSNGELISYKRSTEWLRDAGLLGKTLTAEEANNAFKCTAGMKVALNKGDYRHYLMKLARIKHLNYNEMYKRLCSLSNRYIE